MASQSNACQQERGRRLLKLENAQVILISRWECGGLGLAIWDQWCLVWTSLQAGWWLLGVLHSSPSGRRTAGRRERTPHFLSWKPSGAVPEAVWTYSGKTGAARPPEWRAKKTWKVRKENQERHVMRNLYLAFSETKEIYIKWKVCLCYCRGLFQLSIAYKQLPQNSVA